MTRRNASRVSVCLFLVAGALRAAAHPAPVSRKANRVAVSQAVRDLPEAVPDPNENRPALWIRDNETLPRGKGFSVPGDRADAAIPSEAPAGGMPGPSLTFDGLSSDDDAAVFGSRVLPSDANADVGPDHIVETVNLLFQVWDKSGTALTAPAKLSSLFAPLGAPCGSRDDGDPIVLYDSLADRWLISQFCIPVFLPTPANPSHQVIAISQTGDPTGAYYLYDFVMPNPKLNDYPHFGVWADGYYMSDNQFGNGSGSNAFTGAGLFAYDRAKMLVGDPSASYIYFDYFGIDPTSGGMLPTHLEGLTPPPAGTPNLFMEFRADEYGDPNDALRIYEFHADFATPANSTLMVRPDLVVAPFDARAPGTRNAVEQPAPASSSAYLDAIADRMMYRIAYRTLAGGVQSFVVNWTVNVSGVNPTNAATYQAGVRFEELRRDPGTGAFSIQNQVTYAPGSGDGATGRNLWLGSAAQDHQGNSAVGFSASSTTLAPSIIWAGRLAGDPADTLNQGEATMFSGTGVQTSTSGRWGDYASMSVDPSDDCTFWYTQQYYASNGIAPWRTRLGSFKFAGCTAAPKGTVSGVVTSCAGGLTLAGAVVSVAGGYVRTTDATGAYAMDLSPGTYAITVTGAGDTVGGSVNVTDGGTTIFNACLGGAAVVEGAGSTLVAENCPPGNGVLDPGETVTVSFCLQNTGSADTADLVATLQASGGVTSPSAPQSYGVLTAGGAAVCRDFVFTVDPATLCGGSITATLTLVDGTTDLGTASYVLQTGVANLTFHQDFGGATAPAGWTAADAAGGGPLWTTTSNGFFAADPGSVSDARLDSPRIPISSASAQLSFRNDYVLDGTFDGGVLEISIGGGAFMDILAAGGRFRANGYNGTISAGFGSSIAGRRAWTGASGGSVTSVVDLPASAAGRIVVLRWRLGSDASVSSAGWRIESVSITDGFACCAPIAVSLLVDGNPPTSRPAAVGLNKVLEPGETVLVEPGYFNGSSSPLVLTGTASNFTGPAGATYTLTDATASYGSIATNTTANCFDASDCYAMTVDSPSTRPAPHWDSTFDELLSSGATKTWTLHIGDSFGDTPNGDIFYSFIETIFHNGITGGCGAGTYCPGNNVTRAQMAVFILKAEHGAAYTPPPCTGLFTDVECLPTPAFAVDWIEQLANEGITGGCGAGTYCPGNNVTRAQMAVFLLKGRNGPSYVPPPCTGLFTDVECLPTPAFAVNWIEQLYNEGITGGCGTGIDCPNDPVTRGQMAVFLTKTFGLLLYGP